jgi:hypothetical protein
MNPEEGEEEVLREQRMKMLKWEEGCGRVERSRKAARGRSGLGLLLGMGMGMGGCPRPRGRRRG